MATGECSPAHTAESLQMSFTHVTLAAYVALSADHAVLYAVRTKSGVLVSLQAAAEAPELSKGQSFGVFEPTEAEQAFIDLACPKTAPKADPMANRLRKSEVERPVQFVLRVVRENPLLERKALIQLCIDLGVADYTARTQVQVGLKRRKALAALLAAQAAAAPVDDDAEGTADDVGYGDKAEEDERQQAD